MFIRDTGEIIEKKVSVRDLINKITFWLKATADEPFSENVPVFVKITFHINDKDSKPKDLLKVYSVHDKKCRKKEGQFS